MTWWKELMLYFLLTAWTLFWAAFGYYAGYADGKIFQRRNPVGRLATDEEMKLRKI